MKQEKHYYEIGLKRSKPKITKINLDIHGKKYWEVTGKPHLVKTPQHKRLREFA